MPIRRLAEDMVNRIAAGEVVERPASVVKELVENAIDAGATRVEVVTAGGGASLIRVTDDGAGIGRDDLMLAVERHCTSKLANGLDDIRSLGFRGEALAAIGAAARLTVTSRRAGSADAFAISVDGGRASPIRPAALSAGTRIEVRDLFFATPARLKFLKSERAEAAAVTDIVKRLAMAHPEIRFTLGGGDRSNLDYQAARGEDARLQRLGRILGDDFVKDSIVIDAEREGVSLGGHVGLPTFNRANSLAQFLFVNDRPVRDKLLLGALRGAYADAMRRDRYPVAALFVTLAPCDVDVNVHPAKAEVRFRDPGLVRGLIVGAIRQALAASGPRTATTATTATIAAFRPPPRPGAAARGFAETAQAPLAMSARPSAEVAPADAPDEDLARPLGAARAQVYDTYIIAQTAEGLVIVDQHAAHERLVYETLKKGLDANGVARQILLIPEVVELPEEDVGRLLDRADALAGLGLAVEGFGPGAVAVREVPAMLGVVDAGRLVRDIAEEIAEWESAETLSDRLAGVASKMACHGSVRAGRRLKPAEMDALLRQIEATPNASECNHGRPTYIELKRKDVERLFGRR